MASISASTNSTSSLGNTSLRGFGGMASGIDRDSIIEQMTLSTTTKINNQKRKMTQLQWKQEAYRSVSDKILDLTDKYASYASSSNLKDSSAFARNKITVHGVENSTKFVTATGTSEMVDNISILGVKQTATSASTQSNAYQGGDLTTALEDLEKDFEVSNLQGSRLTFATYNSVTKKYSDLGNFTFPSTYKDDDNKTQNIDYYTNDLDKLVGELNLALKDADITINEKDASQLIKFENNNGKIQIGYVDGISEDDKKYVDQNVVIRPTSSALSALGYTRGEEELDEEGNKKTHYDENGISIAEFNEHVTEDFLDEGVGVNKKNGLDYMTEKTLTFTYNGSQKQIKLITDTEAEALKQITDKDQQLAQMAENLKNRLEQAFGKDTVEASVEGGKLTFKTHDADDASVTNKSTLSIAASDAGLLKNLGLEYGSSTKINLNGNLSQSAFKGLGLYDGNDLKEAYVETNEDGVQNLKLYINGVKIDGLTVNSSVSDILSKINSTTEAGVKATYVEATGKFMLVASETGKGRTITLGNEELGGESVEDSLAYKLFGGGIEKDGENAVMEVSYGGGDPITIERSSNTFNLEGLNVTVSGTFGYKDENHTILDNSQAVTFTAKADVDAAVEKVKSFFEDFNALVTEINTQVTTRPDSDYQPLTDEQKAEMDDTSIENWEKKAKEGMLYNDSAMRDLSTDVQAIFTKLMENGASYEDLKEIGITYSEDYLDGGTLVFDESKFREAMETDPDKVADIFTGGGDVKKGLINIVEDTFNQYATRYANRNGGSYGRLIDIAGSEKKPTTLLNNEIYKQLEDMQNIIDTLNERLKSEQDRYISQFTTMETLLNQMNSQSSYLSQLTA